MNSGCGRRQDDSKPESKSGKVERRHSPEALNGGRGANGGRWGVVGVVVDVRRVPVYRVVVVIVGGGYPLRKSNRWATRLL